MNPPEFANPPTRDSLVTAQRLLDATQFDLNALAAKIDAAEGVLAKIVRESREAIEEMVRERRALEDKARHTLAYLSPMKRLPLDLLREIFLSCFQNHPCAAWVLASVCSSWRRLALRIPVIWSKVIFFPFAFRRSFPIHPTFICHGVWRYITELVSSLIIRPPPPSVCVRRCYLYLCFREAIITNILFFRSASLPPNNHQQKPSGYGSNAPEIRFLLI